jgi:hypothetical protein
MTNWETHHPPHHHPDFDAYLDTLTEDDLTAINTAIDESCNQTTDSQNDPEN